MPRPRAKFRLTGRTSLIFACGLWRRGESFAGAGSAYPLARRQPPLSASAVVSHLVHAGALVAFASWTGHIAGAANRHVYFGGLGYFSSSDGRYLLRSHRRPARSAALAPLISSAAIISLIFLQAEAKRAADPLAYLALVVGILALRLICTASRGGTGLKTPRRQTRP